MEAHQVHGLVFDIERFSTADGPGIRTVVFLKGCNLHCFWCHNPESIRCQPELELDNSLCIGCGSCVKTCRQSAHLWESGHIIARDRCIACFQCADMCPSGALKRVGQWLSIEDCMAQILPDVPFYDRSGGGVTLSGGEVLMQADFAARLLARCKQEGISTAIETNLCFPRERLELLLPYLDLVMTDIKHMDPVRHRQGTGRENDQVIRNLEYLAHKRIPLILRTPVIPGFNDDRLNIENTARLLSSLGNLRYYELLSYNPMGNDKRKRFGYAVPEISIPGQQHMKALAEIAFRQGLPVWIDGAIYTPEAEEESYGIHV